MLRIVHQRRQEFQVKNLTLHTVNTIIIIHHYVKLLMTNSAPVPKWKQLQDITDRLKTLGFESELMEAAKKAATEAKLNYALEYANTRLSDAVLAANLHKEDNGSYPPEMPEETVKLCGEFSSVVNAIKSC